MNMKKFLCRNLAYLVVTAIFVFALLIENSSEAVASSGVCDTAADHGVCVGSGAKCNIKKGFLTFRCGKDPNGDSIIIE